MELGSCNFWLGVFHWNIMRLFIAKVYLFYIQVGYSMISEHIWDSIFSCVEILLMVHYEFAKKLVKLTSHAEVGPSPKACISPLWLLYTAVYPKVKCFFFWCFILIAILYSRQILGETTILVCPNRHVPYFPQFIWLWLVLLCYAQLILHHHFICCFWEWTTTNWQQTCN